MTSAPQSRAAALISHLQSLAEREDRGALAALRRGLGKEPGTVPEMYRHVEPYLVGAHKTQADAGYLVASLFGLHSVPWNKPADAPWNTGFGWTLSRIRQRQHGGEDEGVARRFAAVLNAGRDALPVHLRQLMSLLHSRDESGSVDWERLFRDVVDWERVDRRVQRSWAEAFWRGGGQTSAAEADTSEPDEGTSTDEDS